MNLQAVACSEMRACRINTSKYTRKNAVSLWKQKKYLILAGCTMRLLGRKKEGKKKGIAEL